MSRNLRILPLYAYFLLFAVSPVLAQHSGMHDHDGPQSGMGGHMEMGEMHGGEMMNHMNMVMDQMSEMMQEMHGIHGEMSGHMNDQNMSATQSMHMEMMQEMSGDMESMMTTMQSMFEHMQGYMNNDAMLGDDATREHMNDLMENLETMMGSGHTMMSAMVDMNRRPETAHGDNHQH